MLKQLLKWGISFNNGDLEKELKKRSFTRNENWKINLVHVHCKKIIVEITQ